MKVGDKVNTKMGKFFIADIVGDIVQIQHIDGGYVIPIEYLKKIILNDE